MIFVTCAAAVMKQSGTPCENRILHNWSNWSPHLIPLAGRTGTGHLAGGFVRQVFPLLLTQKIRTNLFTHSDFPLLAVCACFTAQRHKIWRTSWYR